MLQCNMEKLSFGWDFIGESTEIAYCQKGKEERKSHMEYSCFFRGFSYFERIALPYNAWY